MAELWVEVPYYDPSMRLTRTVATFRPSAVQAVIAATGDDDDRAPGVPVIAHTVIMLAGIKVITTDLPASTVMTMIQEAERGYTPTR